MGRKQWALGAVAVAVAASAVGVTVSGRQVRQAMEAQTAELQQPGGWLRVVQAQQDAGWLSTTRTLTLELGPPAAAAPAGGAASAAGTPGPLKLVWRDQVQHGPLAGGRHLGAAWIDTDIRIDEAQRAALQQQTGLAPQPITAQTAVDFAGGSDTQFSAPAFAVVLAGGQQYQVEGLGGRLQRDASGTVRHDLKAPTLRFAETGIGATVTISDLSSQGESLPGGSLFLLLPRQSRDRIARMTISLLRPPGLGDEGAPPLSVQLQDLSSQTEGTLAQDLYSGTVEMKGRGETGGLTLEAVTLKSSVQRLHVPTYLALMPDLMSLGPNAAAAAAAGDGAGVDADGLTPAQRAQLERLKTGLLQLLTHDPRVEVAPMAVTVAGETGTLAYRLQTQGLTTEELAAPTLLSALAAKASLGVDVAVPKGWLRAAMGARAAASGMPAPDLDAWLQPAAAQGYVQVDGAMVKASVNYERGALTLNGQRIPLPGLPAAR